MTRNRCYFECNDGATMRDREQFGWLQFGCRRKLQPDATVTVCGNATHDPPCCFQQILGFIEALQPACFASPGGDIGLSRREPAPARSDEEQVVRYEWRTVAERYGCIVTGINPAHAVLD
jgi:hypothetical protein